MMLNSVNALRIYFGICISLFSGLNACGQEWLSDFTYRKKIIFNKSRAEGVISNGQASSDLNNFPVLIVIEDPDLRYLQGRFDQKISNAHGLDVSFASFSAPGIPLKFQVESYNAERGIIVCWVQIPSLSVRTSSSPATSVYFYYGSPILHDPQGASARSIWEQDYSQVEHMKSNISGKIGQGWRLNGSGDKMLLKSANSSEVTLSAWIKLDQSVKEQIIVSTDTLKMGGYQFKIDPSGKLVLEGFSEGRVQWSVTGVTTLSSEIWYYVNGNFKNGNASLYINGTANASRSSGSIQLITGGQVFVGASKQNDRYFQGVMDEVRLGKKMRPQPWLKTEYENQNDPFGFYTIGKEEMNPLLMPSFYVFVGAKNSLWTEPNNWNTGFVPPDNANVKIAAGKVAEVNFNTVIHKLLLEQGALVHFNKDLEVIDDSEFEQGSRISCSSKSCLKFSGNVINNGSFDLNGADSRLVFKGNKELLKFSGNGMATVGELEVSMSGSGFSVELNTTLKIISSIHLMKGRLKANGNLMLLSTRSKSACLLPVLNLNETSVSGPVLVQCFIDGSFPFPSTGRGWRLLSSPVMNIVASDNLKYQLQTIKSSVFVTGIGGTLNGFDFSPNNGATIYTHDQALPGVLTQKYLPISNMEAAFFLGKGFFLFSRGSRLVQNAYENQILKPSFSNPEPYLITYSGELFLGTLKLELFNRDLGSEGDGFNLLGNPYASSIRWGSLIKENVGPYVWLFDPLNNTYKVSDNPDEIIPAGVGFFVRVNSGFKRGYISFSEDCKIMP